MKFWNFNLHFFNRIFNKHLIQKSNRKSKTLPKNVNRLFNISLSIGYWLQSISWFSQLISSQNKTCMLIFCFWFWTSNVVLVLILDCHLLGSQSVLWKRHLPWKMHLPLPFWDKIHISTQHSYIQIWYLVWLFACFF